MSWLVLSSKGYLCPRVRHKGNISHIPEGQVNNMLIFQLMGFSVKKKKILFVEQKSILDTRVWTTNTIIYFSHSLTMLDCFHVAELLNAYKFAVSFSTQILSKSNLN